VARSSKKLALPPEELVPWFQQEYPDARCYLNFDTPYQLLIATILSAQCTDERVNRVTPKLFREFPDARAASRAKIEDLEELIRSTGFYHSKARAILECSQALMRDHLGEVPKTLEELVRLRGVGRKTANVVLGNAFGVPAMVVDTHVGRLSYRMGHTAERDPVKIEKSLEKIVPREHWVVWSHWLIAHGRAVCQARKPSCETCGLKKDCPKRGLRGKKSA
jgi:endonuclease-3